MVRICLYQPDIAQNAGTILRTAACLDVGVDIIEPCGFVFSDAKFKRAGMDYLDQVRLARHPSWPDFLESLPKPPALRPRLILLTTKTTQRFDRFTYHPEDILIFGRESAGVPEDIHHTADERLTIPMKNGQRSLNVAVSVGMVLALALKGLSA